jgi:hypothetical protein
VAVAGEERVGYLLGFAHLTFYANGPVGWVEEVLVRQDSAAYLRKLLDTAETR